MLTGTWGSGTAMSMNGAFRFLHRLAPASALALLIAGGAMAAPAHHPIDAATRASIAREAHALLRKKGVTHVGFYGFVIGHDGHVTDAWVVRSAGTTLLDDDALAMIRRAVLKHRPAHAPARMQFVIPIEFHRDGRATAPGAG